jgi:hypothetical protein
MPHSNDSLSLLKVQYSKDTCVKKNKNTFFSLSRTMALNFSARIGAWVRMDVWQAVEFKIPQPIPHIYMNDTPTALIILISSAQEGATV